MSEIVLKGRAVTENPVAERGDCAAGESGVPDPAAFSGEPHGKSDSGSGVAVGATFPAGTEEAASPPGADKPFYDASRSLSENAKEAVKYTATVHTMQDEAFVDHVKEGIKASIKESVEADRKIGRIEKESIVYDKETQRLRAFYEKHKAILSFGGIDEPCDMFFMKTTIVLLSLPFFFTLLFVKTPVRILITIFDAFNGLLCEIAKFSKPARNFCGLLVWGTVLFLLIFGIYKGVLWAFRL